MAQRTKTNRISSRLVENATHTSTSSAVNGAGNQNLEMGQKSTADMSTSGETDDSAFTSVDEKAEYGGKVTQAHAKPIAKIQGDVSEKELETQIKEMKRMAATSTNSFRRSVKTGSYTAETAMEFRDIFTRLTAVVTGNDPKYIRRLWIEQMVAACNFIIQGIEEPELIQVLAPLKKSCSQLQQYCSAHVPDYLRDMLNDIKTIDNLLETSELDAVKLAPWPRRLLTQLQFDCIEYSQKLKGNACEARSEESWGQLTLISERLAGWIKRFSLSSDNFRGANLQQTIRTPSAFSTQFPNRISAELLE